MKITFGHKDAEATEWTGRISINGGQIRELVGWKFLEGDQILAPDSWRMRTQVVDIGPFRKRVESILPALEWPKTIPKGLIVSGEGPPEGVIEVRTSRGDFSLPLANLQVGESQIFLKGAVHVERWPVATKLDTGSRHDDFPSIVVDRNGTAWSAWSSYGAEKDEIRIRRYRDGSWFLHTTVPGTSTKVWLPQMAIDGDNRLAVIWAQQEEGNWDLYSRFFTGTEWLDSVRLTHDPLPDINHKVISDLSGTIWVVWQGFRSGRSQIFLKYLRDGEWAKDVQVTNDHSNSWMPDIAVDRQNRVHVVWDTYRNGNYDIYMRSFIKERLTAERAVAKSPKFEANPSIACDGEGRVWIAWEIAGENWGKDHGYTIRNTPQGSLLFSSRTIGIKCLVNDEFKEPFADILSSLPEGERQLCHSPRLIADQAGRIWVCFYRRVHAGAPRTYSEAYLTGYRGESWLPAFSLPNSWNRLSSRPSLAASTDNLWLAWPTDSRSYLFNQPVEYAIYAGEIAIPKNLGALSEYVFKDSAAPPEPVPAPLHKDEPGDLRSIRQHRADIDGVKHSVYRGDLHRHTELSWDFGGMADGSLLDCYRYMIDVASLDFGASTDHLVRMEEDYSWWLTQKYAELHHLPGTFIPLYAYERSVEYPHGHRNVIYSEPKPVIRLFSQSSFRDLGPIAVTSPVVANDTQLLYDELKRLDGIAIAHTTATSAGTDWRFNDPGVEPVAELFQGFRTSYEYEGAPRSANPEKDQLHVGWWGYEPAGFVWKAWEKGHRLGLITSSDHASTHISYAMVYSSDFSRKGILEAIRKRRTYGATDNMVLECRMGKHFMGDEFSAAEAASLHVKVRGTAPIAQIDVIKNDVFIYTLKPGKQNVEFTHLDAEPTPGKHFYYVRAIQADGQMAWSSPIWVARSK